MTAKKVLSVGQCMADGPAIARLVRSTTSAETVAVDTAAQALDAAKGGGFSLVLVNRIFDSDGGSGLDLIKTLKADPATASVPVMLVSNYPESQAEAVALGAEPGFGKAALSRPETAERLKAHL